MGSAKASSKPLGSDVVGCVMEGTVVKVVDYGAIVRLSDGKVGLIHISEIADCYVRDVRDYFQEHDRVRVKVLRVNEKGRYELSTKAVAPDELVDTESLHAERPPQVESFEDKLSRFMKESQERLLDLKRSIESKRGKRHK